MNARLRKAAPLVLIVILGIVLFVARQWQERHTGKTSAGPNNEAKEKEDGRVDRDTGFDRRISYLEYSNHAKCRMKCRKVSESEVEQIMQQGKINYNKSDIKNARCPRYAVEGTSSDDQRLRIVYAQCNDKTTVVTVIDLDTEWSCHCPGDDKKYNNAN